MARVEMKKVEVVHPGPGQVLVKINWTGLCASDKALIRGEWESVGVTMMPQTHGIVGHEGVGVVVALGEGTESRWKLGDRAGVKWIGSVCRDCEFCRSGTDELHCASQSVSGLSIPGTFQEYCLTDGNYATKIPNEVRDEEAAPILCGGLTAYTACKRYVLNFYT
jgi:propanol-preferring alcohol dehydrogenase